MSARTRADAVAEPVWRTRVVDRARSATDHALVQRAASHGERLVRATRELLDETGDSSFTVPAIAARAELSLTTLYSCFRGKDELVLAALEEETRGSAARLAEQLAELTDRRARLRLVIEGPLTLARAPRAMRSMACHLRESERLAYVYPTQVHGAVVEPFVELLEAELRAAAEDGLVMVADPRDDALVIHEVVRSNLAAVLRHDVDRELEAHGRFVVDFCGRAIGLGEASARR